MSGRAHHAGLQDSASLATRLEGLEKEMEALKEAHGLETDRMTAELARTNEVSCRCRQRVPSNLLPAQNLLEHLERLVFCMRNSSPTSSTGRRALAAAGSQG